MSDIVEFATAQPRYTRCKICLLPDDVRREMEQARESSPQRVTFALLRRWLNEKRTDVLTEATGLTHVSQDQVYRHWSSGHAKVSDV